MFGRLSYVSSDAYYSVYKHIMLCCIIEQVFHCRSATVEDSMNDSLLRHPYVSKLVELMQ